MGSGGEELEGRLARARVGREEVRQRAEKYAQSQVAAPVAGVAGRPAKPATFSPSGSAGVELYAAANTVGALQDSDATNDLRRGGLIVQLGQVTTQPERGHRP